MSLQRPTQPSFICPPHPPTPTALAHLFILSPHWLQLHWTSPCFSNRPSMLSQDLCLFSSPLSVIPYPKYPLAPFVKSFDLFSNVILSKSSSLTNLYKIPPNHHHQSLTIYPVDCACSYLICYTFLKICFDFVNLKTNCKLHEKGTLSCSFCILVTGV